MIPLFKPFVSKEAIEAQRSVMASGYIGQGMIVDHLEEALKPWLGNHLLATNSGTAALWLAYDLADIGPGDYVIASPMSCLATFVPLAHRGALMLWADCDPATGLIDCDDVANLCWTHGRNIRAIVAVHYGGTPCNMDRLRLIADNNNLLLIEDAAHAFGSYGIGQGDYTCYSFQAIKTLTTIEGGALVMRDPGQMEEAKAKRWFGLDRTKGGFRCEQLTDYAGYKFNMVDPNAAVGLANLAHMDRILTQQRRQSAVYDQHGLGHISAQSSSWLHTILVNERDTFVKEMEKYGVQTARPHSRCDRHPFLMRAEWRDLPGVDQFDGRHVCLPNGWWMDEDKQQQVITAAWEVLGV